MTEGKTSGKSILDGKYEVWKKALHQGIVVTDFIRFSG